jgi:hypothetical protein
VPARFGLGDLVFQPFALLPPVLHLEELVQIRHLDLIEFLRCPVKALDERPANVLEGSRVAPAHVPEDALGET